MAQRYNARQVRAQTRAFRDAERARKALDGARTAEAKEQKRLYIESRLAEVEAKNAELEEHVRELSELLSSSLNTDPRIDFNSLLTVPAHPSLELGGLTKGGAPPNRQAYLPHAPNVLVGWLPRVRS